jgi:predicted ester cyclase
VRHVLRYDASPETPAVAPSRETVESRFRMTREEIENRLARHKVHFVNCNPDALAADHAIEGTFESPAHGLVQGRDAIREIYKYWYGGFPDFSFTWDAPLIDGSRVALFWTFEGTAHGPFFGMVREGTVVTMTGAAEYVMSGEGIVSARHVFDFSSVLVKAGILRIKPA